MGVGVESAHSQLQSPELPSNFGKKVFFRANIMQNSGILLIFHNPEIPGLKHRQSIEKIGRDPGIRDWNPYCQVYRSQQK